MEIGTEENAKLVSQVYEKAMNFVHADKSISATENFVYQIEHLSQEVNSGASFEQYFRWASIDEVTQVLRHVKNLDIPEVFSLVESAIKIAFPNGIPEDEDEYEECTEWSEEQEEKLGQFFEKFENYNGVIINKLGEFIIENNLTESRWSEKKVSKNDNQQKDRDLLDVFIELTLNANLENLTPIQRKAYLVKWYDNEVRNGGHWRYFSNKTHFNHQEVIKALRELGANEQASILIQALERLPKDIPIPEAVVQFLDGYDLMDMYDLDDTFNSCITQIEKYLEYYLDQNESEFIEWIP